MEDNRSADKPISGPLMVLAGGDASVNFTNIGAGVEGACRHNLPIASIR